MPELLISFIDYSALPTAIKLHNDSSCRQLLPDKLTECYPQARAGARVFCSLGEPVALRPQHHKATNEVYLILTVTMNAICPYGPTVVLISCSHIRIYTRIGL